MTTYRKTSPAPACLDVLVFDSYNEALEFNRANGLTSRPVRRLENNRIKWSIVRPQVAKAKPAFIKLPHWERPREYDIAANLPCFQTPPAHGRNEPQPTCYASQWDEMPTASRRPFQQRH